MQKWTAGADLFFHHLVKISFTRSSIDDDIFYSAAFVIEIIIVPKTAHA